MRFCSDISGREAIDLLHTSNFRLRFERNMNENKGTPANSSEIE